MNPSISHLMYLTRMLTPLFVLSLVEVSMLCAQDVVYLPSMYDESSFNDKPIVESLTVGTTQGIHSVSPSGAAMYTIPIFTPPGAQGMQPEISLVYNSQGGNGIMGQGWSIAGLSSISRVAKTQYHDGERSGVMVNSNDRYALDGQRLMLEDGSNYHDFGATYRTEMESYSHVMSQGLHDGSDFSPDHFIVETKDGKTIEYGTSAGSKRESGDEVLFWNISRVTNADGYFFRYNYKYPWQTGAHNINQILFTGNDAGTPLLVNKMLQFNYAKREDVTSANIGGEQILSEVLLTSIEVKLKSGSTWNVVKKYTLNYALDHYSYLSEIIESDGAGGNELNKTIFKYQGEGNELVVSDPLTSPGIDMPYCENCDFFTGDFNGDGISDIVSVAHENVHFVGDPDNDEVGSYHIQSKKYHSITVHLRTTDGSWNSLPTMDLPPYASEDFFFVPINSTPRIHDFNGDGLSDILFISARHLGYAPEWRNQFNSLTIYYAKPDGTGFSDTEDFTDSFGVKQVSPTLNYNRFRNYNQFQIGDFTGDGKTDILTFLGRDDYPETPSVYYQFHLRIISPANAESFPGDENPDPQIIDLPDEMNFGPRFANADNSAILDINGDGKNEILLHSPTGPSQYSTKLFELNYHFPPGDCDLICEQVYNTYYNDWEEVCYPDPNCPPSAVADYGFTMVFNGSLPKHFYVGDFNGDGKTDLINQEGGNSKIRFFTGKGGLFTTKTIPQTGNFVADLNGDGMSDLISFREQDYWDDEILLCDQEYYYPLTPCDGPPPENDDNWPGYCSECWISKITRNFSVTYSPGTDFAYTYTSPIWEIEESSPGSGLSENLLNGTRLHFGDINGDGSIDLFQITENSDNMVFMGSSPEKRLLAAVSNGFDNHTRFEYLPLSVGGDFYSKGSGFMHDDILDIQVPLYAVSRVIVPNGLNGTTTNTTEYSYAGASVHTRGKGFLGFQQATTSQFFGDYDITYINKTILQELDYTFFVPKKVKTEYFEKSIIGTELISETLVENQAEASPFSDHNLVFTNQHLKTISKDFEKHRKTIDAVTLYDEDGNPRKGYTYIGSLNADTESEFVKVVEFDHTYTSGNWSPSWKPTLENRISKKKTTTKTPGQATNIVRETDFMYYDNGALEKVITDPGDPKSVTKTYIYGTGNRLGLLVEEKTSASQLPTVITEYPAYNAHRTFATQTKNNAGQTSYQTYDDVFGKIKTSTGINGLTTSYFYDGFGNLLYKEVPNLVDGSVSFLTTHFSSDWAIGSCDGGLGLYSLETSASWKPNQKTWYDKHGREIQTRTEGAEYSEHVFTETSYDQRGNIITQSRPHFSADPRINQTYYYNSNGTLNESFDQTKIVEYGYHSYEDGTETNGAGFEYFEDMGPGGGIYKGKTIDAAGRVIQSTDNGGELTFKYNAADQLTQVMDEKGIVIQDIGYDLQGDQTYLIDKNSGTTEYFYNAYGQLEYQEDANGNVYEFEYDELGRIKNRISPDGTTHYDYYNSGNGINQLKKEWNDNGESIEYHYDQLGRTTKVIETIDSKIFETEYSYDEFGNLETRIYPSGLVVTRKYDALGYPTKVFSDNINGENILVWEALEMNALGQYTKFKRHNNVITNRVYDQFGMPKEYTTSGIQDLRFDFDTQRGILLSRTDVLNGQYEAFEYDEMDRLTVIKDAQDNLIQRMQYDYNGNLKSHSGAGDYDYLSSRINAVTQIKLSSTSAIDKKDAQEITFTAFHSPRSIKQGKYELNLLYGTDQQRKKTVLSYNEDIESTTYFLPQYEWESKYSSRGKGQNNTTEIHYITAGGELQAMFIKGAASSDGNGLFFTYTDYLGSILTLTDQQGTPVANQSFDAWGRKRDYHDWLSYDDLPDVPRWLIRGYTAHEHLDMFDLINMNGRMYDPTNGRMLSVDNYVQDPYSTQGYNRYSYVLNNPLKYTDPSGEFIFTALALIIPGAQVFLPIAIGADIGAITGGIRGALDPNVGFLEGAAKGAFVGAFSGAMSMIGGGVFLANLAWGIGQGAMAGVMDAAMWGGDMGKSALYGAAIGGLFAAATSGIESIKNARDGYGFGTNEGRLRHYFKKKDIKNLSALLDERYGIDSRLEIAAEAFDEINATRPNGKYVFGAADIENNRILLANEAFDDLNIFKATVVHEYAHLKLDFNELGEFIRDGDGLNGYLNEFRNQGKLKINMRKAYSFLSDVEYRQFVNTIKSSGNLNIFQSMPNRFHQNVLLNNFH